MRSRADLPLVLFTQQWLDWLRHAEVLSRGCIGGAALLYDARRFRKLWLAALCETMDGYMRSPAFLDLMQYNLRAITRGARFVAPFRPRQEKHR